MEENLLTGCDLHVHLAGSFYAEDVLSIGAPIFREVDWHARDFLNGYNSCFATELDPIQLFADALANPQTGLSKFKAAIIFGSEDSGDFERFVWKYRLFSHLWWYGWGKDRETAVSMINQAVEHHKQQGLDHVEYRSGFWGEGADLQEKMQICCEALTAEYDEQLTARYIVSLPRTDPLPNYQAARQLLQEQPQLAKTLVGVDFGGFEEGLPPKTLRPFFQQFHKDNQANP
ncbi:hypothetical protein MNBD_CHLOROFLEXI01-2986, partial [hydrothermal vent metagenome]